MSRTLSRLLITFAAAIALVGAGATAASAEPGGTPYGCGAYRYSFYTAYSVCQGGPGYHRVQVWCTAGFFVYGPWVSSSNQSWVTCPLGLAQYYWYQVSTA